MGTTIRIERHELDLDAVEVEVGGPWNKVKIWPSESVEKIMKGWSRRSNLSYSAWRPPPSLRRRKLDDG
jgi:hypothetical protein